MQQAKTRIEVIEAREAAFTNDSTVKIELKISVKTPDDTEHEVVNSVMEAACSDMLAAFQDAEQHLRTAREFWIPNLISNQFNEYLDLEDGDE